MVVWYSLWSFGIFFPFWHVSTKKNLAALVRVRFPARFEQALEKQISAEYPSIDCNKELDFATYLPR
jgi:hypothetical protein